MTPVEDFVAELVDLDVRLSLDGDQLRCSAPENVMTSALRAQLAERKPELLQFLSGIANQTSGLVRRPPDADIPLTPNQLRLWSLVEMRPRSTLYNISTIFRLTGSLDVAALERSLSEIQRRHEILRTSFPTGKSGPRQRVDDPKPVTLTITDVIRDLRHLPSERREPEIHQLLQADMRQPFDIRNGPLWRCHLLRTGKKEQLLSFTMHHIIFDGRSKPIFLQELAKFYAAFSAGQEPDIDGLAVQYGDFALWQNTMSGTEQRRQLAYWAQQMAGVIEPLALPVDFRRDTNKTESQSEKFDLPAALAGRLDTLCRHEKAGLFAVLLAGFSACLSRYAGQRDLVICSPMACRDKREIEAMIGYFNNVVPLRTDLSGDPDFRDLIGRVRQTVIGALDNQNLPLQSLAEIPALARVSLTRGMFSYQDISSRGLSLSGLSAEPVDIRKAEADFEIALYMERDGRGEISGILEYDSGLFDAGTISQMVQNFQAVVETMAAKPDQQVSALPQFGIRPMDIATALSSHDQIDEALVEPMSDRTGSVAYIVLNEHDVPDLDDIRSFIRAEFPDYCMPLAFVPLDEIPHAEDGGIDRSALPRPSIMTGRPAGMPYVAPRSVLEQTLAGIWKKVLWLDQDVGIHDQFSDLGGHSLLSVQLVLKIEEAMQRELPIRALLQLGTIAEMAEILADDRDGAGSDNFDDNPADAPRHLAADVYRGLRTYTATWNGYRFKPDSLIVGMNIEGARKNLFWCLQRYGELTQLAKYLGSDQPVFGMRSGNSVMVKTQDNIEALAAYYVAEILEIQPEGPFIVGGNCQAAKIAFQVARQLQQRGAEVELLLLMEKFVPQEYSGRVAMLYGQHSHRNPHLHFDDPVAGWAKYYSGPLSLDLVAGRHSQFFKEPNIQDLAETIRRRMDENEIQADSPLIRQAVKPQLLPKTAYRADLKVLGQPAGEPGSKVQVRVEVSNRSSVIWHAHERSGILLASQWRNRKGNIVHGLDGRVPLAKELRPGESTIFDIAVTMPERPGEGYLEFDLVDDGIAWFGDEGSEPARLNVNVPAGSGILRLWNSLENALSRARERFQ